MHRSPPVFPPATDAMPVLPVPESAATSRGKTVLPANVATAAGTLHTDVADQARLARSAAYGTAFWLAYASNTLLMVSVSLLFRFSDFVSLLGGNERHLGLIVGFGTIGSLVMRLAQGTAIDRYGARAVWVVSMLLVSMTFVLHLLVTRVNGAEIFGLHVLYKASLAGVFGASITYVSLRAPVERMAEVIGVLGSSGFLGIAVGTQLGDYLFREQPVTRWHVDGLFLAAATFGALSTFFAIWSTRHVVRPAHRARPPWYWLIRRYHPGTMLLMSVSMGIGTALPFNFLRPFTADLGMKSIGTYFAVYTATAFITRILLRRVPERIGVRNTVLLGMSVLVLSLFAYLPVRTAWQLAYPGLLAGMAHALLFPSIVAGGSGGFPTRYRGLGVTLMLGMFDLGALIGAPLAGAIIHYSRIFGLPAYPTMFLTIAGLLTTTSAIFALTFIPRAVGTPRA